MMLSSTHRQELEQASAIDPTVIEARGYRTVEFRDREELSQLGIPSWAISSDDYFPGLLLPMFRATGEFISAQFKPAKPIMIKGKPVKYVSVRGQTNRLDVHPQNRSRITVRTEPLWITEGLKKSDAFTSHGCCVVALTGVFNWRSKLATLGDWEDVPLRGRDVVICFDADARTNINVARAMVRLGRWCWSKRAKTVRYLIVPSEFNGKATKGADDFFAAGGTLDVLEAAATTTEPDTETADDTFSDARLAETIADEVLIDRFVWCKAIGWLVWSGQRWISGTEERVGESVRQYVLRQFGAAVTAGRQHARQGWQSMLGFRRQRNVLSLAKGIVERTADVFDADLDLLNTPSGVVDLATGRLQPHDPDLLITKITHGSYRPGYTHPDWDQALTALPPDVGMWLQARVGQAITGHPTPDGVIPILQGGGENGKSAITTDGIVPALGDYADVAGSKLLASAPGQHPTERADLRGQRFLIAEELTDDRALNITAIKQMTDVGRIKARYVNRDNFTFAASHSLFVTTNYVPRVNETDHGTWRRLALVIFPFTFRKPNEALTGSTYRRGDPGLKARLKVGAGGRHDAIVTWAVEGAIRIYQHEMPAFPATVDADTRAWRTQEDRILGFWSDMLLPNNDACIVTTELLSVFNAWMKSNGHHEWSKERFHSSFKAHGETDRHKVVHRRPRTLPEGMTVSRPSGVLRLELTDRPCFYYGVQFRVHEVDKDAEEDRERSERSDRPGTSTQESDSKIVPERSGQSDQACCKGGSLELSCQLCPQSPTYWQRR